MWGDMAADDDELGVDFEDLTDTFSAVEPVKAAKVAPTRKLSTSVTVLDISERIIHSDQNDHC